MPVPIACPNPACARVSSAPDAAVGKRVKCPGCGRAFVAAAATHPASATADGDADATCPRDAAPAPPTAARKIGRFVVRAKLGAGAFGAVYRAHDPQLDREVALKVPHAAVLDSPKRVERFLREAKAAANLRHPHIVPVYDAGRDGAQHYIASAFVAGRKLADAVEAAADAGEPGLPFDRAVRLVRELAEALAYAHGQGVVHRDVKPDNVMLDGQDRVHLMDFGLAARQDEEESRLTSDGAVMGTPAYMAPEQAAGDTASVGPASDQYACGVVLYELLTGRVPFAGPVPLVIHNHIHTDPEPPSGARADLPRDLETICLKAMSKRPQDRYPDCQALADDLRRWLEGEPIAARQAGRVERAVRWVRKNPAVAGLYAAGVVGVVLVAVAAGFAVLAREAFIARDAAHAASEESVTQKGAADDARAREAEQRRVAEQERDAATTARDAATTARDALGREKKAAETARDEADRQKAAAVQAKLEAEKARQDAEAAREQLAKAKDAIARIEYARTIRLAQQSWRGNELTGALTLLNTTPAELRGPEWQYLDRLCNRVKETRLPVPGVISPDWTRVAAFSNGRIRVFDAASGQERAALKPDALLSSTLMSWSPDGSRLLIKAEEAVGIWAPDAGDAVVRIRNKLSGGATFSPDGNLLLTIGGSMVRAWEVKTGTERFQNTHIGGAIRAVGFNPDKTLLAAVGDGGTIWNVKLGLEMKEAKPVGRFTGLSWDPAGGRLLCLQEDGAVQIVETRKWFRGGGLIKADNQIVSAQWSPVRRNFRDHVLTVQIDGTATAWDVTTPPFKTAMSFKSTDGGVIRSAKWSPSGARIATAGEDGVARVWDAQTGAELTALKGHAGPVLSVAWSADGTRVLTNSKDGLRVWNVGELEEVADAPNTQWPLTIWSPDRTQVARRANTDVAILDRYGTQKVMIRGAFGVPSNSDERLVWSPDGTKLLACTIDGCRGVWDAMTGNPIVKFDPHMRGSAVWSPDGRFILFGSGTVWDMSTGRVSTEHKGYRGLVEPTSWSPCGTRVFACLPGAGLRVWNPASGATLIELKPKDAKDWRWHVGWSPDGSKLITAGPDGTRAWNTRTGEEIAAFKGKPGPGVYSAWSPDGKRVVTNTKSEAQIWDADSWESLGTLAAPNPDGYKWVGWDRTSSRIVTGGYDNKVRVWEPTARAELLTFDEKNVSAWEGFLAGSLPLVGADRPTSDIFLWP